jgi:hypothetical protein
MADIRRPAVILDHPDVARLINFGQPADLLCGAVLQLAPDAEDPEATVAQFRDHMYAGSYLTLCQFASDSDPEAMAGLRAVAAGSIPALSSARLNQVSRSSPASTPTTLQPKRRHDTRVIRGPPGPHPAAGQGRSTPRAPASEPGEQQPPGPGTAQPGWQAPAMNPMRCHPCSPSRPACPGK